MVEDTKSGEAKKVLRRDFLTGTGAAIAAGALAAVTPGKAAPAETTEPKVTYPTSTGYIVYDSRVCWGCLSCMFACSVAHQGEANPTLSRIQIVKDAPSFAAPMAACCASRTAPYQPRMRFGARPTNTVRVISLQ